MENLSFNPLTPLLPWDEVRLQQENPEDEERKIHSPWGGAFPHPQFGLSSDELADPELVEQFKSALEL